VFQIICTKTPLFKTVGPKLVHDGKSNEVTDAQFRKQTPPAIVNAGKDKWVMRREFLSQRFTTQWSEIPAVKKIKLGL
jgi:hypothetical protein